MAQKTRRSNKDLSDRMAVDSMELAEMLGCGRHTATNIGTQAGAKIQIGRRVLWNTAKVQEFINMQSR